MIHQKFYRIFIIVSSIIFLCYQASDQHVVWFLPVEIPHRQNFKEIHLTKIGSFAEYRKARPGIPAHFHTGIDIMRPEENYIDEVVYPIGYGKVISLRNDGPYAQIIIEHHSSNEMVWSVYEHIAGIIVKSGDEVNPGKPIGRFMNKKELDQYGWQFNHLHLEILKVPPKHIRTDLKNPFHHFSTYNLECFTLDELKVKYYNPYDFFKNKWFVN